jgi:NADH-quinone oxidoreductase subunit E
VIGNAGALRVKNPEPMKAVTTTGAGAATGSLNGARSFAPTAELEARVAALVLRYPRKRSVSLMALHAVQEMFGCIGGEAIAWLAGKLELQPIQLYELVTFYPMFRQEPAGRYQIKVCRTLSCALGGSHDLHRHICGRLGLDAARHGVQTTADGRFSIEFVECLASCGTAPVLMCNDDFYEGMTPERADALLTKAGTA